MIFVDTNLVSESVRALPDPRVAAWIRANDTELAISTVALAEIAFGIERIRPDERARRLTEFLAELRNHFAVRIYPFDEESAMIYGAIMGEASRQGRALSVPDGMIAAIALRHNSALATRNTAHFHIAGLRTVNPWE